jgi:hypothetical protein
MPSKPGSASPPPSPATAAFARLLRQLRDRADADRPPTLSRSCTSPEREEDASAAVAEVAAPETAPDGG